MAASVSITGSDDLDTMYVDARAAAKRATWVYRTTYVGGAETISRREPDDHTLHLTGFHSWHYAEAAGCSKRAALAHLRKLVAAGRIVERRKISSVCDFSLLRDDAIALGREIIAELRAEGLPFDDEWRARREIDELVG